MRLGTLKAVGHNIASSLASGCGLMIGIYDLNVFGEAAKSIPGFIEVDFVRGSISGAKASEALRDAARLYSQVLPELCRKHSVPEGSFVELRARYGTDSVAGAHFRVMLEDSRGRRSDELYLGVPGNRFKRKRSVPLP